jgi:8-oxo-dGTP pyrophosphatase MutT (NUDIX family)
VSRQPDITVAAVVMRDGRFLVVEERIGGREVLNQPAGHLERGETLLQAVIRETLEETAWTLAPAALLGAYLWQPPRAAHPTLRFAFVGEVTGHDPDRALDHPVMAAHWMSRAQLEADAARLRSPLVLRCVDDFLAGRRQPLALAASLDLDSAARFPAAVVP